MDPCHTKPFVRSGMVIPIHRDAEPEMAGAPEAGAEVCDYCGSTHLEWRKCKLVCAACKQINKSCADL